MKRSNSAVSTTAIVFGLLAMAGLSASAQITVFNDNLATDASDPSASYLSANTIRQQRWMDLGEWHRHNAEPRRAGKLTDLVGSFSAVSLANAGDYVSFVVNFNSPNIGQGGAGNSGDILFAFDNSEGTPLFNGLTGPPWVESNGSGKAVARRQGLWVIWGRYDCRQFCQKQHKILCQNRLRATTTCLTIQT